MNMIALEIELALERDGLRQAENPHRAVAGLDHRLDERGRPPQAAATTASRRRRPSSSRRALFGEQEVACPQCGSDNTELLSEFGSTSCKALWRCKACREPFDYFKCHWS